MTEDGQAGEAGTPEEERHGEEAMEQLLAALGEKEEALARRAEAERALLERYRLALLATEPAIPAELVAGESAEEIEASFAAAKELAERVRRGVRAEDARRVPAGAPGRAGGGPLSAFEKIRAGLAARSS